MPELFTQDALQAAFNFAVGQTTVIEPGVYRMKYPTLNWQELVPVDTAIPEWATTVTYFSMDGVGRAEWMSLNAKDVPTTEVMMNKYEVTVAEGGIGYEFGYGEVNKAQMSGVNLPSEKAFYARRAYNQFMYNLALLGDASKGFEGLYNHSAVSAASVAADGSGSTTTWATKTPDQIVRDVNALITGIYTATLETEIADTVILPSERLLSIGTIRLGDNMTMSILEYLRQNNIYTQSTGRPLTIFGKMGLLTAGAGSTARMIAYRRSPEVLKMYVPMPHQFLPMQQSVLRFIVPGIFRTGGIDVKLPKAIRYGDGI